MARRLTRPSQPRYAKLLCKQKGIEVSLYGIGPSEWRWLGVGGLMVTCGARRALRESRKRFGRVRALALKLGGYGCGWLLRKDDPTAWPDIVQHHPLREGQPQPPFLFLYLKVLLAAGA